MTTTTASRAKSNDSRAPSTPRRQASSGERKGHGEQARRHGGWHGGGPLADAGAPPRAAPGVSPVGGQGVRPRPGGRSGVTTGTVLEARLPTVAPATPVAPGGNVLGPKGALPCSLGVFAACSLRKGRDTQEGVVAATRRVLHHMPRERWPHGGVDRGHRRPQAKGACTLASPQGETDMPVPVHGWQPHSCPTSARSLLRNNARPPTLHWSCRWHVCAAWPLCPASPCTCRW